MVKVGGVKKLSIEDGKADASLEKKSWTPFHQRGSQRGLLHTKKKNMTPLKKVIKKTPS